MVILSDGSNPLFAVSPPEIEHDDVASNAGSSNNNSDEELDGMTGA